MNSVETSPRDVKAIVDRYKTIGLLGGLFLGGVTGVMVAGPNFQEWSGTRSLSTIFGSDGLGGLIGYFAGEIAAASLVSGAGSGSGSGTGGAGGGGGSGHGDSGGEGGGDS